ncbi:LysE/ArgO family amino acid transporter [Paracoccus seriniphilus]|uniref:L-lysine exporter family protein LysE/ArgO n=1 Tax=Paracoccus seriniphilus TaxID=184748 RepID=A0A239PNE0_9RHOB|nr:LysE/ArgO family amino acid transporter [Paracoccus seriniphilus]WCR14993.1 amino acid transporter [Paracoccus seriniphilus]SNT71573.1 L-lysine exporter family protein LysE/ArgO [Paracoccus seriniphilus]
MMSYVAGLGTALSLIMAIGAQNAFVLKQGLLRSHVLAVILFCACSDAVLIILGVTGMAAIAELAPWLIEVMRWGGVAFLLLYGARSFRAAIQGGEALTPQGEMRSLKATLAVIAALTWLNPHVWLDTVMLLGSISAQWPSPLLFGAGAVTGSFVFFFALGYGARLLAPVFARPRAWQWLEVGVGIVMWGIALRLILE